MRLSYTFLILVAATLLMGCGGYTEYRVDSSGRMRPVAHYRDLWQKMWDEAVAAELRGDPPLPPCKKCPPCKTWKEYWQKQYAYLESVGRQGDDKSWAPKQVARLRELRIEHGLDPYR